MSNNVFEVLDPLFQCDHDDFTVTDEKGAARPFLYILAQVFIDEKKSELVLVDRSLSIRNSMASMVPIGFKMRRST